jgi:hypothetical protein
MQSLESMRLSTPADFWRLLRKPATPGTVAPAQLIGHYRTLLEQHSDATQLEECLPLHHTSALDFTPREVKDAIHSLKNNKALGLSWISPEILKNHKDDHFYHALATFFNQVRE